MNISFPKTGKSPMKPSVRKPPSSKKRKASNIESNKSKKVKKPKKN